MDGGKDRTTDVEQRLRAIQVDAQDTCVFWTARDGTYVTLRQCMYCMYGKFGSGYVGIGERGVCRFKR